MSASSSETSKTIETQTPAISNPLPSPETKTLEDKNPDVSDQSNVSRNEEDDEEGECGFCLFMKGGGCKESFIAWEKCVEDGEKNNEDIVEKCFEITSSLKKCMDAHADYYEPILRAEKAAEEEAIKELEVEAASKEEEEK